MRFIPFVYKSIKWKDIEQAEVINYGFIGGWGIRFGSKYGVLYNIKGNKGLHIKLKNGDQLVVGTQKEDELKDALKLRVSGNPE
ncbi:MAG: hypothetical protein ACNS60_08955 [Candidatus Cyclobacteriaceae bacterium M2_1C_046]